MQLDNIFIGNLYINKLDKKIFLKEVLIYEKNGKLYDLETRELYHKIAEETNKTISLVLNELSLSMKNKFERSDA